MKCLRCNIKTPFSSREKLCPTCGGKLTPGSSELFATFAVVMVCLYFVGRVMGCYGNSPKRSATSTTVSPSTMKWSGSGPDCTPDGHPDPKHPGTIISDRDTPDCPQTAVTPTSTLEDANALDKQYDAAAVVYCGDHADDYLRSVAKYDFRWDDIGVLDVKFGSYSGYVKNPGILTLISNKASLQNSFGAYRRITLLCDYDTQNKRVLGYAIRTNGD